MATYVIGDVQGCALTLDRLLARLPLGRGRDRVLFAGDLVNRGPASAEVLRMVKGLGAGAESVLGNHDLHALARHAGVGRAGRRDTLDDLLAAPDREELFDWLRRRPLLLRGAAVGNAGSRPAVLVHAGLPPRWSVDDAARLADEAAALLGGAAWAEAAAAWAARPSANPEECVGAARAAATCVALATVRMVDTEGRLDSTFTGAPEEAPAGLVPWYDAPGRRSKDHVVVFGHWAALGVRILPTAVAVDAGCVWGRALAAVRLDDLAVFEEPRADA